MNFDTKQSRGAWSHSAYTHLDVDLYPCSSYKHAKPCTYHNLISLYSFPIANRTSFSRLPLSSILVLGPWIRLSRQIRDVQRPKTRNHSAGTSSLPNTPGPPCISVCAGPSTRAVLMLRRERDGRSGKGAVGGLLCRVMGLRRRSQRCASGT